MASPRRQEPPFPASPGPAEPSAAPPAGSQLPTTRRRSGPVGPAAGVDSASVQRQPLGGDPARPSAAAAPQAPGPSVRQQAQALQVETTAAQIRLVDAGAAPGRDGPGAPLSFDQRVYAAVARIPVGRLATYGQIAELIGAWGCARQVGWALRRLPLPSTVPWQRVVNAAGRIAMTPSREGSDWIQRELLLAEGIPVEADGRLPLARFRWHPESLPFLDGAAARSQP